MFDLILLAACDALQNSFENVCDRCSSSPATPHGSYCTIHRCKKNAVARRVVVKYSCEFDQSQLVAQSDKSPVVRPPRPLCDCVIVHVDRLTGNGGDSLPPSSPRCPDNGNAPPALPTSNGDLSGRPTCVETQQPSPVDYLALNEPQRPENNKNDDNNSYDDLSSSSVTKSSDQSEVPLLNFLKRIKKRRKEAERRLFRKTFKFERGCFSGKTSARRKAQDVCSKYHRTLPERNLLKSSIRNNNTLKHFRKSKARKNKFRRKTIVGLTRITKKSLSTSTVISYGKTSTPQSSRIGSFGNIVENWKIKNEYGVSKDFIV
uniref:Uncharacterized protein n=1 Tax=Romanomermis culicivorax TaxID=13658 RepID=A0A915HXY8_ROMCU